MSKCRLYLYVYSKLHILLSLSRVDGSGKSCFGIVMNSGPQFKHQGGSILIFFANYYVHLPPCVLWYVWNSLY